MVWCRLCFIASICWQKSESKIAMTERIPPHNLWIHIPDIKQLETNKQQGISALGILMNKYLIRRLRR